MQSRHFQLYSDWAASFCEHSGGQPTSGEYYDLPDLTVYINHKLPLPSKGRIEVNCVCDEATEHFHWIYEITLDDTEGGEYRHLLLQKDGQLVETYGKNVIVVDDNAAESILKKLIKLSDSVK